MQVRRVAITAYRWVEQFFEPRQIFRAARGLFWYASDWRRYAALQGAEQLSLSESYPQLHDRVGFTPVDPHYFYGNGWAMRRVVAQHPTMHVDVGSQAIFVNLLAATIPVIFVDYRPLAGVMDGVLRVGASILALPFADRSVQSLSCLHVAEHIGLGRYGDPLDPEGTRRAGVELARVLRPGGHLLISTLGEYYAARKRLTGSEREAFANGRLVVLYVIPVGRPRVCFNAHRVHSPQTIRGYFASLDLVEFSAVQDDGRYKEHADPATLATAEYACGLFHFRKPS